MFTRLLIIHMCDVIPKDPDAFPTCTQILLPLCFSLVLGIIDRDVPIIGGPGHGDCGAGVEYVGRRDDDAPRRLTQVTEQKTDITVYSRHSKAWKEAVKASDR
jgi:hypothetical protein